MFTPHAWKFFGFGKAGLLYSHCNHYNLLYSNQNLLYSKYNLLYSPCNLLHSKNKSFLSQNIFLWSSPFRSIPKYNSAFKPFLGQPKSVLEAFKPFRRQPKPVLEAFKPFRGHPKAILEALEAFKPFLGPPKSALEAFKPRLYWKRSNHSAAPEGCVQILAVRGMVWRLPIQILAVRGMVWRRNCISD